MVEEYIKGIDNIIEQAQIKKGEKVLIVFEHESQWRSDHLVAEIMTEKAREKGASTSLMYVEPVALGGSGEPDENVRQAMFHSDLTIFSNNVAILYTRTVYEAIFHYYPTRIIDIIGAEANRETLATPHICGNPSVLAATHLFINEKLFGEKEIRMTSKTGTDFTCYTPPGGMWTFVAGTGRARPLIPGQYDLAFWQGEGIIWPRETGNGVIYFDGFYGCGYSEDPIICHFKDGWCTKIESGGPKSKADKLIEILEPFAGPPSLPHPANRHCTEWACGISPTARIYLKADDHSLIEAQRNIGVCHVAIGSRRVGNPPIGHAEFNCGIHLDGTILEPTVTIDGETVIEDGWATYLNDPVLRKRVEELGEDPDVVLKQERKVVK